MSMESKLRTLSERSGIPLSDLQKRLEEIRSSRRLAEEKAFQVLRGELRRESGSLLSPAIWYTGVIFGDTGVIDFVELMKRKAVALYSNPSTRNVAISEGLTDRTGTPLDVRKTVNFVPNPNYGKPFREDDHSYQRILYGVASKVTWDPSQADFFRLTISGEKAMGEIPLFSMVSFKGNKRQTGFDFLDLNYPRTMDLSFKTVEEFKGSFREDVVEVIYNSSETPISLADLENLHRTYSETPRYNLPPVVVEAFVSMIGDEEADEERNRTLVLDDEDFWDERGVICFLPTTFPIHFGLDSKVIFVGETGSFKGEEERFFFRAYGYYPIPEYLVEG